MRTCLDSLAWLSLIVFASCAFDPGPVGSAGDGAATDARPKDDGAGIDGQCGWGYTPEGDFATCRADWGASLVLDMVGTYQLDVDTGLFTQPNTSSTTLTLA